MPVFGTLPTPEVTARPVVSAAVTAARLTVAGAAPAAAGQVMARLVIPSIGVDTYVVEGLTFAPSVWEGLLRRGPAHLQGSALPGAVGESIIFGHLNVWGSPFLHLEQLAPGAAVQVQLPGRTFEYRVTGSQVVSPSDSAALAPEQGVAGLALVTCTGLFDTQRLVVRAELAAPGPAVPTAQAAAFGDVAGAVAAVIGDEADVASGAGAAAAALWGSGPPAPGWDPRIAEAVPPTSAFVTDAWPIQQGLAEVQVREQFTDHSRAVAFAALGAGTAWTLVGERVAQGAPPHLLSVAPPAGAKSWVQGDALCGAYRLHWGTGAVGQVANGGFHFDQRPAQVQVAGPDGVPLSGIAVPGLTLGSFPVACGDLLGDGGQALVLRTDLPQGGGSQVAVYQLERSGARLIGQMSTVGAPTYPRVVQPVSDGPAAVVVRPTSGAPEQWWLFSAGSYRVAGAGEGA